MAIRIVSASPIEHEAYLKQPDIRANLDMVSHMIDDLSEDEAEMDILLVFNDTDNSHEYSAAFGGTTLSMDFYEDRIDITAFNEGDEQVLSTFALNEVNVATQWLINLVRE